MNEDWSAFSIPVFLFFFYLWRLYVCFKVLNSMTHPHPQKQEYISIMRHLNNNLYITPSVDGMKQVCVTIKTWIIKKRRKNENLLMIY